MENGHELLDLVPKRVLLVAAVALFSDRYFQLSAVNRQLFTTFDFDSDILSFVDRR